MDRKSLMQKIAYLEFAEEKMIMELTYVDNLLRIIGFQDGIETMKIAALELIDQKEDEAGDPFE